MRQNPNMIRTLLLLSFTLVFLLAYAVHGASSNSGYYVYESEQNSTSAELSVIGTNPTYQNGKTVWLWEFETNTNNLTWINVTVEGGVDNSILKVINIDGNFWSHPELGDALNTDTNCADRIKKDGEYVWVTIDCQVGSTHTMPLETGNGNFISLSHPDPALRDGGTVRSDDYESGLAEVNSIFNRTHQSKSWQISIEVEGDHTEVNPSVEVSYVNEKIISVELFKIDAVTEMLWSMAALIGCFMILLVPAFLVYFISQKSTRNERKELELALEQDRIS